MNRFVFAVCVTGAMALAACGSRGKMGPQWVPVVSDTALTIALDTSRVQAAGSTYLIWFETKWTNPRPYNKSGKIATFNRASTHVLLSCEPLETKMIHMTTTLNDGPLVSELGRTVADTGEMSWLSPPPHSADEDALTKTCAMIKRKG